MREDALRARRSPALREWRRYAVAACVMLAVASAGVVTWRTSYRSPSVLPGYVAGGDVGRFGIADLVAPPRRALRGRLPDGSRVDLAPSSAIDLPFSDAGRTARLVRGSATLDVRHDSGRPFS